MRHGVYASFTSGTSSCSFFFFFNDTATTEIYTLSLHDALPISASFAPEPNLSSTQHSTECCTAANPAMRSEEHTSELQSQSNLVCRLLLEKKKKKKTRRRAMPHNASPHISSTQQSAALVCSPGA